MVDKALTIDTTLGLATHLNADDPVMITQAQGQEGISMPFVYDVVLLRSPTQRAIDPSDLIGTAARIGIRREKPDGSVCRTGVFSHLEKVNKRSRHGLVVYRGRLIPLFQMVGREASFRVFENKDVPTILDEVLGEMRGRLPDFRFDTKSLKPNDFPKLEYCVQFGESSFGFLTRLMQQHGIWYFFDHDQPGDRSKDRITPETLVLGHKQVGFLKQAEAHFPGSTLRDNGIKLKEDDADDETIASFVHQFEPALTQVTVGNFNVLKPLEPVEAKKTVLPAYNLFTQPTGGATQAGVGGFLTRREFPAPVGPDPATTVSSGTSGGPGDARAVRGP